MTWMESKNNLGEDTSPSVEDEPEEPIEDEPEDEPEEPEG